MLVIVNMYHFLAFYLHYFMIVRHFSPLTIINNFNMNVKLSQCHQLPLNSVLLFVVVNFYGLLTNVNTPGLQFSHDTVEV